MDVCHFIKIEGKGIATIDNLHVHLNILEHIGKISLSIYPKEPFEKNKNLIINWIRQKKNYSEFAKSISINKIRTPDYLIDIDYSKSKIGGIINTQIGSDRDGKFFAIGLKRINFKTKQFIEFKDSKFQSEIYLDNHAYDLLYQLINVDGFESDAKTWKAFTTQQGSIQYCDIELTLDFDESLTEDSSKYLNLINRKPRIIVDHEELDYSLFLRYTTVLCSAISFYQGHKTEYEKVIFNQTDVIWNSYSPQPKKKKLLTRNLGRFRIDDDIFTFLSKLSCQLLGKSDFVNQTINLFNQGIYSEGTTEFMLYFTVLEKLRNHYFPPKKSKEKFSFNEKKTANDFLRAKLGEIQERVIQEEQKLWSTVMEDKLVNLKYLPQKDQFNPLFDLVKVDPSDFGLVWQKVVSLRGRIFHGKYVESDDAELIELNVKMRTFLGNVLFRFMTNDLNE